MNDLAEIIDRFWTLTEQRIPTAKAAVAEMRSGKPKAVFVVKDAVHATKGEAQLLRMRNCATLMVAADALVSRMIDAPHTAQSCDALDGALTRLERLCGDRGAGDVEREIVALNSALEAIK